MKLKSCIICSGPAGSGEHVFPASLGGRRTNRNIYCTTHDNGYSPLVAVLDAALAPLNQIIGVVNDHTGTPKAAVGVEGSTGELVKTSVRGSEFVGPRVISKSTLPNGERLEMGFNSKEELDRWIEQQEKAGVQIQVLGKGTPSRYFPDTVEYSPNFGGPDGLAAVAYIAQTFLAQAFPEIARSSALDDFKRFTTTRAAEAPTVDRSASGWPGEEPVWWDFGGAPDLAPNAFEFGHRVVVGVDGSDGLIYGRVSLFSSLNFSMIFGRAAPGAQSKTVVVDIDPLAPHPPNDIYRAESASALARVERPADEIAALSKQVESGEAERTLHELVGRLMEHALTRDATALRERVLAAAAKPAPEFEKRVAGLIEERSQRVWNLLTTFFADFRKSPKAADFRALFGDLQQLVARDPVSPSGLSADAMRSIAVARDALVEQVLKDYAAGVFTEERAADLLGRGPGIAVVGEALLLSLLAGPRSGGSMPSSSSRPASGT